MVRSSPDAETAPIGRGLKQERLGGTNREHDLQWRNPGSEEQGRPDQPTGTEKMTLMKACATDTHETVRRGFRRL